MNWHSIVQSTVVLSTSEVEYITMTEAMKEAMWLQGLLEGLGID